LVENIKALWYVAFDKFSGDYRMSTLSKKITEEALSLPVDLRLRLVDVLINSLNAPTRPEIDDLWAQEAENRIDQVDRGEIETLSGEAVFERIRKRLRG
jgi:putative addiction module component (TIGR02574 family)